MEGKVVALELGGWVSAREETTLENDAVRSIPMTKKAAIVTLDIDTVFRLRVWIPCFL
jgi:hypothetical protein